MFCLFFVVVDSSLRIYWSRRYWSSAVCDAPGIVQPRCQVSLLMLKAWMTEEAGLGTPVLREVAKQLQFCSHAVPRTSGC